MEIVNSTLPSGVNAVAVGSLACVALTARHRIDIKVNSNVLFILVD